MLLQFDRPCRIFRQDDGSWGWTCWCCEPPLSWTVSTADSWTTAIDDADAHIRHDHAPTESRAGSSVGTAGSWAV